MKQIFTVKQKVFLGVAIVFLFLNIFAWKEVFALAGPQYLEVNFLDIGQGDAILMQTPDNRRILVDGGPDSSVLSKLGSKLPFWEKSLDMVILTHPDADHLMGLLGVLKKYKVGYVVWTGAVKDNANFQQWARLLEEEQRQGAQVITVAANDKIISGEVVLSVISPVEKVQGKLFKNDINDTSIVAKAMYGQTSFLLTGDITGKVEKLLAKGESDITADVLKVAHHGSKTSTSEEFLNAVNPDITVISAGRKNRYGHPTPEILQRLEKFGIPVLRTDQRGDVTIISDGRNIKIGH